MRSAEEYIAATCIVELITVWCRTDELVMISKRPERYD